MRPMRDDEVVAFMREGSRTGKLGVVRADGRPHVVPIWFDFDDDTGDLIFVMGSGSLKARCIARDPRVTVCVDEMQFPFAFARIDGVATTYTHDDDPEAMLHWATETCRRFVGDDRAEEFGRRNADPHELLVRVRPTRHVGATGVAD
ncbi:MAG: PPOX class F420-dependent oxidoreductase [Acidimicrobiia bacterium]|nr:PPOX class F420-dependent oxidoreductase [Acidimicrobiia bacterium]